MFKNILKITLTTLEVLLALNYLFFREFEYIRSMDISNLLEAIVFFLLMSVKSFSNDSKIIDNAIAFKDVQKCSKCYFF
jgi:hypothetical protein